MELSRLEAELHHEEDALRTEAERLGQVRGELQARLERLHEKGQLLRDAGVAAHGLRKVPVVDVSGELARAREAREAAVRARQAIVAEVRQRLAQAKAELKQVAQAVLDDEQRVAALEAEVRAKTDAALRAPPPPPREAVEAPRRAPAAAPGPRAGQPTRQRPRVQMQAAVDLSSDDNFFNGFSSNISDGGLFVATVNLVPLGTEVDLSFSLPSGVRVQTRGVVRWVREVNDKAPDVFPGLGVQFKDLDPASQAAINQFLAEREPLFYAE
jgi:uncharacterized protein (TIGR02266 family)